MRRHVFTAVAAVTAIAFVAAGPPANRGSSHEAVAAGSSHRSPLPAARHTPPPQRPAGTSRAALAKRPTPAPHGTPAATLSTSAKTTATVSPSPGVVGVAVFTESTKTKLKSGAAHTKDPYQTLVDRLRTKGVFRAWIVDGTDCPMKPCNVGDARIYIYGKQAEANGAAPASFTYTSFFVSDGTVQRIGSVALPVTEGDPRTVRDLTDQDLHTLIGQVVLDDNFNFRVALPAAEYALQLVPKPVNATDPDFEPILEHLLAIYDIPAVRSTLPAGAIGGPNDPVTCPGAQRYFVYRVRIQEYPKKLTGHTRLAAYSEGYILDCTAPHFVPAVNATKVHNIPTTAGLIGDLTALGLLLYPKIGTRVVPTGNAFANLVDGVPRSSDARDLVAGDSLAIMVDRMCIRLLEGQPSPSPMPSGVPSTPSPSPTASALFAVSRATPEPLLCKRPLPFRRQTRGRTEETESFTDVYDRWSGRTTPSPAPAATPRP